MSCIHTNILVHTTRVYVLILIRSLCIYPHLYTQYIYTIHTLKQRMPYNAFCILIYTILIHTIHGTENDDYKGMDPKQAKEDFMNRVHAYEKVYQVSIYAVYVC